MMSIDADTAHRLLDGQSGPAASTVALRRSDIQADLYDLCSGCYVRRMNDEDITTARLVAGRSA